MRRPVVNWWRPSTTISLEPYAVEMRQFASNVCFVMRTMWNIFDEKCFFALVRPPSFFPHTRIYCTITSCVYSNVVFQFQQRTILFNSVIFGIFSQYSRIRSHFELYSLVLTRFSEKFLWSNFILIFWNGRRGCKGCHSYQKYLNSTFVVFWHFWEMFCHIVLLFNQQRKIVP